MGTDEPVVRRCSDDEPFAGLAFKIMTDPFVGSLDLRARSIRACWRPARRCSTRSRTAASASAACCRCTPTTARTSRRRAPATSSRSPASRARRPATRCAIPQHPVVLERMEFPEPVIEIAVEPKTKGDQEKMGQALARLATEDPSFRVAVDHESGQTIIKGMGELHLEIIVDRMKREFKVDANVGAPQVAYRETITRPADIDYTHKKQTGGAGPVCPGQDPLRAAAARRSGFVFENEVVGGAVPKEYIPGVEKGAASGSTRKRRARRLPGHRLQGRADRRRLSRSRIRARSPSRSRRAPRSRKASRRRRPSCSSRSCGSRW